MQVTPQHWWVQSAKSDSGPKLLILFLIVCRAFLLNKKVMYGVHILGQVCPILFLDIYHPVDLHLNPNFATTDSTN
uniref:Uncharacterized protein n=1 Tax=Anguilla anguilla TaxID=7936 RepID=A0A0E9U9U3_ANGAN